MGCVSDAGGATARSNRMEDRPMSKDYSAAADWVERDMTLPQSSMSARRAQAAADCGRDLLARAGGRHPLPEDRRLAAMAR
jgi:hypothetical protein